jgi:hypothetical protein
MAIDAGLERLRHAVLEKGQTMIVKFHPRGGGGAGPVDYLLGKDRQQGASVCRKPEEVRELIDASPYAKVHLWGAVVRGTGLTARPA